MAKQTTTPTTTTAAAEVNPTIKEQLASNAEALNNLRATMRHLLDQREALLQPTEAELEEAASEVNSEYDDFQAIEFLSDYEWQEYVLEKVEWLRNPEEVEPEEE